MSNPYLTQMRSKTVTGSQTGSALISRKAWLWQNNKTPILATVIGIPVILLGVKFYRQYKLTNTDGLELANLGIETIEQEGSANELTMESFIEDIDGGESILTLTEDIEEPEGSSNLFTPDFEEIVEQEVSFNPGTESSSQISSTSFQF